MAIDLQKYKLPVTPNLVGSIDLEKYKLKSEPEGAKGIKGFGVGALKGAGSTIVGAGQLFEKVLPGDFIASKEQFGKVREKLAPKGTAEKIGFGAEQIAEFFAPVGAAAKVVRIGEKAIQVSKIGKAGLKATKALQAGKELSTVQKLDRAVAGISKLGVRAGVGAAEAGAVTALQTGGEGEEITRNALLTAGFVAGLGPIGALASWAKGTRSFETLFRKAVRPSVAKGGTQAQATRYITKAKTAVDAITQHKGNIKITDTEGFVLKGQLPKTVNQLREAVSSTKNFIYKTYSSLAKKAGKDANVELSSAAKELNTLAKNKVLQDVSPETANYAKNMAETLLKRGKYSPEQAQQFLEELNGRLANYYRNPAYSDFSKAKVDALIANNLRKSLDKNITEAVGEGYQKLKNQYGALSEIERDVARRANTLANANQRGLIDFSDIFSAGDVVASIVTGSPAFAVKGVAQFAVKQWIKNLNNADKMIERIFAGTGKSVAKPRGAIGTLLFGTNAKLTVGEQKAAQKFQGFLDKPKLGMSIEDVSGKAISKAKASGQSFDEWVKGQESKYKGVHEAPTRFDGDSVAPSYALDKIYPADIYSSNATRYYSSGMPYDAETISTLQSLKGKPNATITVYRAVPGAKTNVEMIAGYEAQKRAILKNGKIPDKELARKYNLKDSSSYYDFIDNEIQRLKGATEPNVEKYAINEGDWVTPNRKYAIDHGMSNLGGNYKILSKKVRADELFTDANSIQEFGYSPRESSLLKTRSQLKAEWDGVKKIKK